MRYQSADARQNGIYLLNIEPSLEKDAKAIRRKFAGAGASVIASRSLNFLLASLKLLSLIMLLQEPVTL